MYGKIVYLEDVQDHLCTQTQDMPDISLPIISDEMRIRETCAKYLGTVIPWRPLNSRKKEAYWNYYHDKDRHIGWCLNPKVCK